jgi:hypothetical protein
MNYSHVFGLGKYKNILHLNKILIPVPAVRSHIIPLGGLRPLIRSWSRDTAFSFAPP